MDLFDWFFKQPVTEGEMDEAFDNAQQADQDLMANQGLIGVMVNGDIAEHFAVPDLTVDIAAPVLAYDQTGQRIFIPGTAGVENIDVSVDSNSVSTAVAGGGNEKIVSVFVQFARALSNPRIDGNSVTVDFNVDESFAIIVEQGAEAGAPATPPALKADALLLGDITRTFGQTQIFDADIDLSRKESTFKLSTVTFAIDAGTQEEALQDMLQQFQNHVDDLAAAHAGDAIVFDPAALPVPAGWSATAAALDVQAALDGIVDDLSQASGVDGAGLVGFDPTGNNYTASDVATALVQAGVLAAAAQTWTGTNIFDDAQISDNNSLSDVGADDDAARDTPLVDTTTTTVATNLTKKLIYQIETSAGEFLRLYAQGNGFDFTRNASFSNAGNTWNRDIAADSHLWRFAINNGFEYIERLAGEADAWADTSWFIAGRHTGFGVASPGEEILVEDEGVLSPGPSNDTYSAEGAINRGVGVTETIRSHVNYGFTFPANPSTATKTVITETQLSVAPAGATFRPNGMSVIATTNVGSIAWEWMVTFDVS